MIKTKIVLTLLFLAALSGCAAPANKQAMTVQPTSVIVMQQQKGKFVVEKVTGGKATNPMWTSQVSQENFEGALKDSLFAVGLHSPDQTSSIFKIDADLVSLEQPMFGLTFDVVSTVNYRVYKDGFEKKIPVKATGTATVSDALIAIERLKLANEKSIQENIKAFIIQLNSMVDVK